MPNRTKDKVSTGFGSLYDYNVYGVDSSLDTLSFLADFRNKIGYDIFYLTHIIPEKNKHNAVFACYHLYFKNHDNIRCYIVENRCTIEMPGQLFDANIHLFGKNKPVIFNTEFQNFDFLIFCATKKEDTPDLLFQSIKELCGNSENCFKEELKPAEDEEKNYKNFVTSSFVHLETMQNSFFKSGAQYLLAENKEIPEENLGDKKTQYFNYFINDHVFHDVFELLFCE